MSEVSRPTPTFRQRMQCRLAQWYHGKKPHPDPERQKRRRFLASLTNKTVMSRYIKEMGLPMPELYCDHMPIDEVDFRSLPNRVVIKPNNSACCHGVALLDGRRDVLNRKFVMLRNREQHLRQLWQRDGVSFGVGTKVVAEEFLRDFDKRFKVPRDFKVYTANGRVGVIQVNDRSKGTQDRSLSYFTRDWDFVEEKIKSDVTFGPKYDRPDDLEQLVEMSERLSADLGVFYRFDFYMTTRGPVFGEFTSYPAAGVGFTPFGDRLMCGLMDAGAHAE